MSLWAECPLNVEHGLAHHRCSLSGDGCGCHGDGFDEGFHAKSSRWESREFMHKRSDPVKAASFAFLVVETTVARIKQLSFSP